MNTTSTPTTNIFDNDRQRKYLLWCSIAMLVTGAIFALTLPLLLWYLENYGSPTADIDVQNRLSLSMYLLSFTTSLFATSLTAPLLHGITRMIYQGILSSQSRGSVISQYLLGVSMCAIAYAVCAIAILDPHGWGLISGLAYGLLGFIGVTGLFVLSVVIGGSYSRAHKTSLFQMIPLLALLFVAIAIYSSTMIYGYSNERFDNKQTPALSQ